MKNTKIKTIDLFQKSSQKHFSSRRSQADEPRMSDFSAEKYATARKVVSRKTFERGLILSAIIFLSVFSFVNTVNAAGPSLYVSPASLTKIVGDIFNASVGFNSSGSKVCAVEGTLVFNNLTCQSITVANDVTAQSSPTCSNPHFLIGVQSCTTADKVLFTISVKAESAGIASISPTGVDIIGEGASLGSASTNGNYTINAIPKPTQQSNGFVGYVNGKIQIFPTKEAAQQAGVSGIEPNYKRYPAGATTSPIKKETATVDTATTASATEALDESSQLAAVGVASTETTNSNILRILLIIVIVLGAGYGIYYFKKKRKI